MSALASRNASAAVWDDRAAAAAVAASHHNRKSRTSATSSRKSRPPQTQAQAQAPGQGYMHAAAGPPTGQPNFRAYDSEASPAPVTSSLHPATTSKSTSKPSRLSRHLRDTPLNVLSDADANARSRSQYQPHRDQAQAQPQQQQQQQRNGHLSFASNFPQSFERWETLSSHWEGLTNYWLHRIETNRDTLQNDPLSKQMARQITDLSASGANLFHALVELQRQRASSERKYQRWYNDAKATAEKAVRDKRDIDIELAREKARCSSVIAAANQAANRAIHQARDERVRTEQKVLRELQISRNEARRAWEELGRREQEERQSVAHLRAGKPAIIKNIEVVPVRPAIPRNSAGAARMESDSPVYADVYDMQRQGSFGLTDPFSEYGARESGDSVGASGPHNSDPNRAAESTSYPPREDELSSSSLFEGHDLDDPSLEEEDDNEGEGGSGSVPHRYVSHSDSEDSEDYGTQVDPQQGIHAAFKPTLPLQTQPPHSSSLPIPPPPPPPPPPLAEPPRVPLPMPVPMPVPMNRQSPRVTVPMPYLPRVSTSNPYPYMQPEVQSGADVDEQDLESPYTHDAEYSGTAWSSPTSDYVPEHGHAHEQGRDHTATEHPEFFEDPTYDLHRVSAVQPPNSPPASRSPPPPPQPATTTISTSTPITTVSPELASASMPLPPPLDQSSPSTQDDAAHTIVESSVRPHAHPTRLSDVIEEEEERSQRSQPSQGGTSARTTMSDRGGGAGRVRMVQ